MTNQREPVQPGDMAIVIGVEDLQSLNGSCVECVRLVGDELVMGVKSKNLVKAGGSIMETDLEIDGGVAMFCIENLMKITPPVDIESEPRKVGVEA